jgi:hypothetical protein
VQESVNADIQAHSFGVAKELVAKSWNLKLRGPDKELLVA